MNKQQLIEFIQKLPDDLEAYQVAYDINSQGEADIAVGHYRGGFMFARAENLSQEMTFNLRFTQKLDSEFQKYEIRKYL